MKSQRISVTSNQENAKVCIRNALHLCSSFRMTMNAACLQRGQLNSFYSFKPCLISYRKVSLVKEIRQIPELWLPIEEDLTKRQKDKLKNLRTTLRQESVLLWAT